MRERPMMAASRDVRRGERLHRMLIAELSAGLRGAADRSGRRRACAGDFRAGVRQRACRLPRARGGPRSDHPRPPPGRVRRPGVQHAADRAVLLVLLPHSPPAPPALQRPGARSRHAVGSLQHVRAVRAFQERPRQAGEPAPGGAHLDPGLAAGLHAEAGQPAVPAAQPARHARLSGRRGAALRALVHRAGARARVRRCAAELRADDPADRALPRHDLPGQPHRHARDRARRADLVLHARDRRHAKPRRLAAARFPLRRLEQPHRASPVPVDADGSPARRAPLQCDVGVRSMNLISPAKRGLVLAASLLALGGCSVRQLAVNSVGDAIAQGGAAFSSDDDPELVRAAAPFSLKLIESMLDESPDHQGLLLAAARGFTQYAYAFVQQEAEEAEAHDLARASQLEDRARRMYRRARDYGLRGLALNRPEFERRLRADPRRAAAALPAADVPLLYWAAAAWGALIGLSKDQPDVLGELPVVEALMDRALELDESFERGAIHSFMIGYESVRQDRAGDPALRSRRHFARAMQLSGGTDAAPLLALAEAVCVPQQRRAEFEALLRQALRIDTDRASENRLANLVAQRRARWLLSRTDHLFTD